MFHNNQLLSNVTRTLAVNDYYNLGQTPTTIQQRLNSGRIFDGSSARAEQTLSAITGNVSEVNNGVSNGSNPIQSLLEPSAGVRPRPYYNEQPNKQPLPSYTVTPKVSEETSNNRKESFEVSNDTVNISFSKTSIVLICCLVLGLLLVHLWVRQQKLELILAMKYHDIDRKAIIHGHDKTTNILGSDVF